MTQDLLFKFLTDKWLRLLVLLLLLAGLAYQASIAFWHFYPVPEQAMVAQRDPIVRAQNNAQAGANYQQQAAAISQAYLFGKAEVSQAVVVAAEEAPETQLNYKLRGTYFSDDPRLASAIVEVQPNKTQNYQLGEELADNITLAAIKEDHILINRYGKIERLNLLKELPDMGSDDRVSSHSVDDANTEQHTALLRSYKKRYASNPMALATRFQAIPVQQDGQNIGFKLKSLRGESLLKKLDLEDDDIFTAVNGVSLSSPFEALDALKSLTTADNITLTILRNGSEQTLDFRL